MIEVASLNAAISLGKLKNNDYSTKEIGDKCFETIKTMSATQKILGTD